MDKRTERAQDTFSQVGVFGVSTSFDDDESIVVTSGLRSYRFTVTESQQLRHALELAEIGLEDG